MIAAAFTSGQRVTDADGNRATFLRMGDKRNGFNWRDNVAIVRYVGERHESACPAHDLTPGWRSRAEQERARRENHSVAGHDW